MEQESPACNAQPLDAAFSARLLAAWREEKQAAKVPSSLHLSVSRVLSAMGVEHENEGAEDIDIVVHRSGQKSPLALEVDGPSHYTSNRPYRPLAHTTMKTRLLRALGWGAVLRVPFFEWDELCRSTEQQRREYMGRLLAGGGAEGQ